MLAIGTERQTLTLKDFLWLAGCRNSSPVFFHWRNERILSEFILLGPLAATATGFVNLIYQSFHFNRGEGWIFKNKSLWFPSRLCDPARVILNTTACLWFDRPMWRLMSETCWGSQPLLPHQLTILGFEYAFLQSNIWAQNQPVCL